MNDTGSTINHNAIVAKSNEIIGELAKFELSELRLLAFCLAHYDSRPLPDRIEENREITARVDDLKKIFKMSTKDAYAVVKRAVIGINKKPYEHFDDDDSWVCDFWFTQFKYKTRTGEFTFKISPDMEPHLLELQGTFTKYRLRDVYQFRAASTWKLYEHLAQWRKAGRWAVSLDDLRAALGVAGKYPRWDNFYSVIIAPGIKEITKHSDLNVECHQEKRGRRIVGLVFLIDKKVDPEVINQEPPEDELCKLLLDHGINAKTAQDYAKKINGSGKTDTITAKMPQIVLRAQKNSGPTQKYILGAIKQELAQMSLFEAPQKAKLDYAEALECWQGKNQKKEVCPVRQKGVAGQRKKCQICLDKMPVSSFGVSAIIE